MVRFKYYSCFEASEKTPKGKIVFTINIIVLFLISTVIPTDPYISGSKIVEESDNNNSFAASIFNTDLHYSFFSNAIFETF